MKRNLLTAAVAVAMISVSAPALAAAGDECQSVYAPAMPTLDAFKAQSTEQAYDTLMGALQSVKQYQGDLKSYRDCLDAAMAKIRAKRANSSEEQARKDASLGTLAQLFNASVDEEARVVNEFQAIRTNYCERDPGAC